MRSWDWVKFATDRHEHVYRDYDLHVNWLRMRFERKGKRIRIFLEDTLIFDYTETEPDMPKGGHIALWTSRNGVVYARLNSSAESIRLHAGPYVHAPAGETGLPWRPLDTSRVYVRAEDPNWTAVHNRFSGGEFSVRFMLERPVDLTATPVLKLPLDIARGVKVNLHVKVSGRYFVHALAAPTTQTYRVAGDVSVLPPNARPAWRLYADGPPFGPLKWPVVGGEPRPAIAGVEAIDLLKEARRRFPRIESFRLEELVIGNTSHEDYLMAGLSGNAAGASYRVGAPVFEK